MYGFRKKYGDKVFEEVNEPTKKSRQSLVEDGKDQEGLFFSKTMVIASLILYGFIVACVLGITLYVVKSVVSGSIENAAALSGLSPLSAAIGAIATGATVLPVTICVNYYKKTTLGHTAKVEAELYRSVLGYQFNYNKAMMKQQHDLKLTDAEVSKIESQSKAKVISDSVFNDASSTVKNYMNDATQMPKKETGA